ncbi:MAG: nuclear transport factor 2 family protein, partial [Actinomycetota bacterium]|nr:nuclear transport factor 2 family protein [Actinomycetota bacterium]
TVLHYAGDGLWSYEEDAYNPANMGEMVTGWIAARKVARP